MNKPQFEYSPSPVITPKKGCLWAETMVLNPAIIKDMSSPRLHMLFRASGPWPQMHVEGQPFPYPIFLGYAFSDDNGITWEADFSRPALLPALGNTMEEMYILTPDGKKIVNHTNGLVEDPRLFTLDGKLYMTVAGRLFPPGPFWEHDDPMQCAPDWAKGTHSLGRAASENLAVSVLYEVDLEKLKQRDYEHSFTYVTHLTDPEFGDNRDVFLFQEKMLIDGKEQYVCIHRPREPYRYPGGEKCHTPTMYVSAAETFEDFPTHKAKQRVLAKTLFYWEEERVGGSWPPLKIADDEWLMGYHGKKDDVIGYTQSFMILKQPENSLPEVIHRCSERMMFAQQDWELPGAVNYNTRPCVFSCGGITVDSQLIISYGASDEKVGIAKVNFKELISYVRQFDAFGNKK